MIKNQLEATNKRKFQDLNQFILGNAHETKEETETDKVNREIVETLMHIKRHSSMPKQVFKLRFVDDG